jgi:class III lanthionine synthetase
MDVATGTAGVLLALAAALHDYPVHLPFLGPLDSDRRAQMTLRSVGERSL